MARPKIQLDQRQFEELCNIHCTLAEIASVFGCSEDTVERWCKRTYKRPFADVYKEKGASGRAALRRNLWDMATHNAKVAMYLANNVLGMTNDPSRNKRDESNEDRLYRVFDAINNATLVAAGNVAFPDGFGKADTNAENDTDDDTTGGDEGA